MDQVQNKIIALGFAAGLVFCFLFFFFPPVVYNWIVLLQNIAYAKAICFSSSRGAK